MAALTLRAVKGSPLTNNEVDANFTSLDQAKVELAGDLGGSTSSPLVVKLYGRALSSSAPTTGQALIWTGTGWAPGPGAGAANTSTIVTTSTASLAQNFPYGFSAYANNVELQTITPGSQQKVKFQTVEYNVGSFYSSTISRFQPLVEGYYQINAEVRLDGAMGTGVEQMVSIWKNGGEYKRGWNTSGWSNPAGSWFAMTVNSMLYLNGSTDYVEIYCQHGNSGNLTVTGVAQSGITWFNAVMIPKMVSTSITVNTTSTVTAFGNIIVNQPVNLAGQFDDLTQVFNLKTLSGSYLNGSEYTDSNDLEVVLGGKRLAPWIYDSHQWAPFQSEFDAGRNNSFRMRGSKIIFYGQPRRENTVFIKINTKSASRQVITRPFSPNNIVFGD